VPLKHVSVQGVLEAGHSVINVYLSYANTSDTNPIECTFEFPLEDSTVVSKLEAEIDNRFI
jgi:hypothetical protein